MNIDKTARLSSGFRVYGGVDVTKYRTFRMRLRLEQGGRGPDLTLPDLHRIWLPGQNPLLLKHRKPAEAIS